MEISSDSDTTDEWIVINDDGDDNEYLIKDHPSLDDDVIGCMDCPDDCGVSDARTTSLGFTEEGNPPDNGEVPPAQDLEVHDQGQNFAEQVEDLSDMSSYTKEELPEDIDMTPAVRHYVHKKNVNLNSLLNIYLALAMIAATALGFGNFLGWSYCSSLKGVLQKQEQMLEQLQSKLSDCNSHLNASHLLSVDSGNNKHSKLAEEIKYQDNGFPEEEGKKKSHEDKAFPDVKNLRNLIHYPLSALESRSDLSSFMTNVDKNGQAGILRHVLYFQNAKPNTVNIKSDIEHLAESHERKGNIAEFVTHKSISAPISDLDSHSKKTSLISLSTEGYKQTLSTASAALGKEWKESQLNLKFPDLYIDRQFSDMATVLDMSHFNIAFPQKKDLESQENFPFGSVLAMNRINTLDASKITNVGVTKDKPKHEFKNSQSTYNHNTQDKVHNYHTASLIYSMNNILSLQQIQNIKEDHFKGNLNITQVIFQKLLENLREKLEDIKNFTLSPLFVKHSHYSQKAVKKLLKVFDSFMGRLLKYSDKFLQKNIRGHNNIDKLSKKMLSCMNKLDCKWQKIKDKWQHLIQHGQSSENVRYKDNRCDSGDCSKKKLEPSTDKYKQDKPDYSECFTDDFSWITKEPMKSKSDYRMEHKKTVECLKSVYFGGGEKQLVEKKSDYQRAVEQFIKDEIFGGGTKDKMKGKVGYRRVALDVIMKNKFSDGRTKELLKDKKIREFLSNIYIDEIPKEQVKSKSDYQTVLKRLRDLYCAEEEEDQVTGKSNCWRILDLLRHMYFGDVARKQAINASYFFRTMDCVQKNRFPDAEINEPEKDKADHYKIRKQQKTAEHFRAMDFRGRAKRQVKDKSDVKKSVDHIMKDEFYDVRMQRKERENKSTYWKTAEYHMNRDIFGRKAKEEKDESDFEGSIEHLINTRFAWKAKKRMKVKKAAEHLIKDEFFGGRGKDKKKNRSVSWDREQNYENKSVFEKNSKNGKGKDSSRNRDKINKREKHTNSNFKKSEKIFKYKEDSRRDFINGPEILG